MIQRCQGFKDLSAPEMAAFRSIETVFLQAASGWGYREIRTPTIEYLYLFTSAGTLTPGKLRRTYSFLDWDGWSGERVVLKPDATIPVARMHSCSTPAGTVARYAYVTNTFMFDSTGKKTRERWQLGAELIGSCSSGADGELVAMAMEVIEQLKVPDVRIRLSHSGLIRALLEKSGLGAEEYGRVFDELLDGNEKAIDKVKDASPELARVFGLMLGITGKSVEYLKNLKALLDEAIGDADEAIDDFIRVAETIQSLGYECEINLASAKGYEYYTGIIFHLLSGDDIIGGGGRYDNLVGLLGGPVTPAAGFGLYMDRLMRTVGLQRAMADEDNVIAVKTGGSEAAAGVLKLAVSLRREGLNIVILPAGGESPSCRFTIEVYPGEAGYRLRDEKSGMGREISEARQLLDYLQMEMGVA